MQNVDNWCINEKINFNKFKQERRIMKTKKMLLLAMVVGGVMLFSTVASAAPPWYDCTVLKTGVDLQTQTLYVRLQDTTGTYWTGGRWFTVTSETKIALAVCLTAMSNGNNVSVNLASITAYSPITFIYLLSE